MTGDGGILPGDHRVMRPVDARLALALLVAVSGGGAAYVHGEHQNDNVTTQQAQQIGAMRTLIEQANQHCNELRIEDMRKDMRQTSP